MSFRTVYNNTHSENGWRMVDRNECDLVRIPELYMTETAPLRKGAPLVILGAWLFWYDRNVEEIETSVWGWSATNDVANSNHLSGTAVDVNAPKYPWGVGASANMTAGKIAKIREGLAKFEGTVFWGEDWTRKDPMHYQMAFHEGDRRNEAFALKLQAGYLGIYKKAEPPVTTPASLSDSQKLTDIREQLTGGRTGYPGWPQLGGKTQIDAIAAVGIVTRRIAAHLGLDYSELNGFKKP